MTSSSDVVVSTRAGDLRGEALRDPETLVFRGIRYGETTAGPDRFRPPRPALPFSGIRDARQFGAVCPQDGKVGSYTRERRLLPQGEDCLFLNVWTPARDGARPVMVWLHGRGFGAGAGSEPLYDGARLAARGDVVVVTINHRLNAFGYLYLEEIAGPAFAGSGLAGMLDAQLALEWVRDNIAAFGGDPGCVTIFGESGGGMKVSTLLAMPTAKGLFHRAIIQSGPGIRAVSARRGTANARALMAQVGAARATDLLEVPTEKLRDAATAVRAQFAPVVDGVQLPVHPFDPAPAPTATEVPILVGSNRDEAALFLLADPTRAKLTEDELLARLEPMLGDARDDVLAAFRATRPDATPWQLFVAISSQRICYGSSLLAERQAAAAKAPVYLYSFELDASPIGAAHGLEIAYVFANASATDPRAEVAQVERDMMGAWVRFARTGDPNHAGLPAWAPYSREHRATMFFDAPSRVVVDPRAAERVAYDELGRKRAQARAQ